MLEDKNRLSQNVNNIVEFTLLFNKYKKRLYNYVLKMTEDRMLTDDIIQEVFIKLYGNMDLIRNKQSVQYWLFKTARNEFYTLSRNTKLRRLYDEAEDSDELEIEDTASLEDEFENKELTNLITDELDKIRVDQREIFILKEYSGLTYKEIASLMEMNVEDVKSKLYKVRQKLIKRISKLIN